MTEQERIETLITALEIALDIASEWASRTGIPTDIYEQLELLWGYAKHEREKQGTMTMSNEVMNEKKA